MRLLIERATKLRKKDFVNVTDFVERVKSGKRIHVCEYETEELAEALNDLFEKMVKDPRMNVGNQQTFDSLISEECGLLAKYLTGEKTSWIPRQPTI